MVGPASEMVSGTGGTVQLMEGSMMVRDISEDWKEEDNW